jgi:hypothetical protein
MNQGPSSGVIGRSTLHGEQLPRRPASLRGRCVSRRFRVGDLAPDPGRSRCTFLHSTSQSRSSSLTSTFATSEIKSHLAIAGGRGHRARSTALQRQPGRASLWPPGVGRTGCTNLSLYIIISWPRPQIAGCPGSGTCSPFANRGVDSAGPPRAPGAAAGGACDWHKSARSSDCPQQGMAP